MDQLTHQFSFARQPILDKNLGVFAYELLFRPINNADGFKPNTTEVIVSSFIDLGFEQTTNNRLAFLNMTYDDIMNEEVEALPHDKVILEILEDVKPDAALHQRVEELIKQGFSFALDDFVYSEQWDRLIELSDIIKFDLSVTSLEENKQLIEKFQGKNIKFLAEKVETRQEFTDYLAIGCEYFQGYFFCKPENMKGTSLDGNTLTKAQLIADINKPDPSISEIETIIKQDPKLTYQLLNYLNSPYFAFKNPIGTISQAIVLLGVGGLKKWVTLIALRNLNSQPSEIMRTALVRASLAEQIAIEGNQDKPDSYFLVGLLSNLDVMLSCDMNTALSKMPLETNVKSALIDHSGHIGDVLKGIIKYEAEAQTPHNLFSSIQYLDACQLADQAMSFSS